MKQKGTKSDRNTGSFRRYKGLSPEQRADAAVRFVREQVHPKLGDALGKAPSKEEQEDLLGM